MRFKNVKKLFNEVLISGIILSLFAITACGGGGGGGGDDDDNINYNPVTQSQTYGPATQEVYKISTTGNVELTYTLDLGTATKDVYFIFTNSSLFSDTNSPYFLNYYDTQQTFDSVEKQTETQNRSFLLSRPVGERGKPEITAFNSNPWMHLGIDKNSTAKPLYSTDSEKEEPSKAYAVGNTNNFKYNSTSPATLISATCRLKVTDATEDRTLYIWVADNCYTGGTKARLVDDTMIQKMADKFLKSGSDADIYSWVSNIYGSEWGTTSYNNLISFDKEIHILLYDIDNDNSTSGGTLGFFWAKDNYKTTSVSYSNAKIMFYIDAVLYATKEDTTWEETDYWPEQMFSTLAHEFQHMLNFYQKNIVSGAPDSDAWINEMCSLVTEDLVADKLGVVGASERLGTFNNYNDAPLATWLSGDDALISYAVSYAFGAYLSRNYNSATLFKEIVQGGYGDYRDVITAVNNNVGSSVTMLELLRNWGVDVILSDNLLIAAPNFYKYGSCSNTIDTINYTLASLDFYSYSPAPNFYTTSQLLSSWPAYKSSNTYVKAPGKTGVNTWKFRMRDSVQATVVVR